MDSTGCTPKKVMGVAQKLYKMYKKTSGEGAPAGSTATRGGADILSKMAAAVTGDNKWKLTNIGGIGTDEDKALRKKAAESEAEFDGAGAAVGIEVWRVEKFKPAKQPARAGNLSLYSGDCYIVLKTSLKPDSEVLEWQLHYWIGKDSTQDESGSAAYFTVNLDDLLNQKPVQHREVQDNETAMFHSYFQSVTYLDGGIDSGFKTVTPQEYKPRLLQMTGTGNNVRVAQVPLEGSSLNNGDVFVLDNGLTIYQFNAPNSNVSERRRAMEIVEQDIRPERNGMPDVTILDGAEVFECEAFWELLGGKLSSLPEAPSDRETGVDDTVDFSQSKKMFKISDESGSLVLSLEKESSSLSASDVDDDDVWAVACDGKCFIYVGARANKDEKFYVCNNVDKILLAAELDVAARTTFFSKESDADVWNSLFD